MKDDELEELKKDAARFRWLMEEKYLPEYAQVLMPFLHEGTLIYVRAERKHIDEQMAGYVPLHRSPTNH
jgi:hypothetical protein